MKAAIIAAIVAALVASGATYAATTINGRAIARHSIPANRLTRQAAASLRGRIGPTGLPGPVGPPGTFDPTSVIITQGDTISVPPGGIDTARVFCDAGYAVLGGGGWVQPNGRITGSYPIDQATGWEVTVRNDTSATMFAHAYATCAP
jgi:hypothetical protein